MYEQIKERFYKGYITGSQLERYVALNVITQEQFDNIVNRTEVVVKSELDAAYKEGVNSL